MADNAPPQENAAAGMSLPMPLPALAAPPPGGSEARQRYFDPERWDGEAVSRFVLRDEDRVATGYGLLEGRGRAAVFFSDFHIADATAGGDDFLESHLRPDEKFGGLYSGFFPAGASRAPLFLSALTFAMQRVAIRAGADTPLDVVLNGDVLNFLDLKGRGGTFVSERHAPFFRGLAALESPAAVYWLRGNHDYVVPTGPWHDGEFYINPGLQTLAEHGDFWDKENWPPGPANKGSRLIIEAGSAFEVNAIVSEQGAIDYLMSGIDNLRPWNNPAVQGFLKRRGKYSDVAALGAILTRLKYVGAADDSAAYAGALERRQGKYRDWLMVQGHTHVPAAVPGIYYNLGTWITSLIAPKGKEAQVEVFPFLLVYLDPDGRRVEEYFIVRRNEAGGDPRAFLQTPASVDELRKEFGYPPMIS
jgi:hypothetical protein